MAFAPTAQQQAFTDALTNTPHNLALLSGAGTGKTTTIIMGVKALHEANPRDEIVVCAFNAAIAKEVGDRLKGEGLTDWRKVGATTIHSLGSGLVRRAFNLQGDGAINKNKVRELIMAKFDPDWADFLNQKDALAGREQSEVVMWRRLRKLTERLVMLAKDAAFGAIQDATLVGNWIALAEHHGIDDMVENPLEMSAIITMARQIFDESLNKTDQIDFADMILFPLAHKLAVRWPKDVIIVDEAQDLSPARMALIKKFIRPQSGRLIVVGDPHQAIYGFTGADAQAMPRIIESFECRVFPLSVTWRCPKAVVAEAERYVPAGTIEAAEDAPAGNVLSITAMPVRDVVPGDAILCRNMAPLTGLAYEIIRAGTPAKIEGKDISSQFKALINRMDTTSIDDLIRALQIWKDKEFKRVEKKSDAEERKAEIDDKVNAVLNVCTHMLRDKKINTSDVIEFFDSVFVDGGKHAVILSTYHRSKGREWKRVFLFNHHNLCPSRAARSAWQLEQENNLAYVAITRAMETLVFVNIPRKGVAT